MRTILFTFSLFITVCVSAQATELLNQERWPDGTLRATRYREGDRIHFITFHENGLVKEIGCFRDGRRDGIWKQFSDSGALLAKAGFRNGQRQGVWEFRDAKERLTGRLFYADGALARGERYDDGALLAHQSYD